MKLTRSVCLTALIGMAGVPATASVGVLDNSIHFAQMPVLEGPDGTLGRGDEANRNGNCRFRGAAMHFVAADNQGMGDMFLTWITADGHFEPIGS